MLKYFSSRAVKENETLLNYIFTATKCLHFLCGAANPLNQRQLLTPWVEKRKKTPIETSKKEYQACCPLALLTSHT